MYKDRFRAWDLHKNLRSDEVLALLRIEAYRNSTGDSSPIPIQFSRYGRPIGRKRLVRYHHDHPHLGEWMRRHPPDDAMVRNLIESFLPSRGLAVISPTQQFLRDGEWCTITETVLLSFQRFKHSNRSWELNGRNLSIILFREATWKQGISNIMAVSRKVRNCAYSRIQRAYEILETDLRSQPGSLSLDTLWLLHDMIEDGEFLGLGCQLVRHLCRLSEVIFGNQSPYFAMFLGLKKVLGDWNHPDTLSFKQLHSRVSEALIDIIASRVHSGSTNGTCHETMETMHKMVGSSKKAVSKAALGVMVNRATSNEEHERVAGILIRMYLEDGEYMAAYPLCKKTTQMCDDIKRGIFYLHRALECYALLEDWEEFERVVAMLELGYDKLLEDLHWEDILFNTFFNDFGRRAGDLKTVLVSIKKDNYRDDYQEAEIGIKWLEEVLRIVLEAQSMKLETPEQRK